MDLLTLAILCGPWVAPATTLSIIRVESGGHLYAVHDNTTHRSFNPATLPDAVSLASTLIGAGHRIDVGLMQINYDAWFKPTGVRLDQAFNACTNVAFGTTILSAAFARERVLAANPSEAFARALSVYNSGNAFRSRDYATLVLLSGRAPSAPMTNTIARAKR